MEKKWNLQDIRPVTQKKRRVISSASETIVQTPPPEINDDSDGTIRIEIENSKKSSKTHLVLAFVVFFVIVGLGFVASMLLSGAEVTVYPRHRQPVVNATFQAFRVPQTDELAYEILSLQADGERQVSAEGQQQVTEQAKGKITIYKKTPGAERLIKNTRFQSPAGLVFRIAESAVVPGAVKNAEGVMVPGSITAEVFADAVGEQYNLPEKTNFAVPGFKEGGFDELFDAIYAVNDESFAGGFDGMKFTINEGELNTAKQSLQMELRDALLGRVGAEKPAGFIVFDSAITFTYQSLPAVQYGDNLATIKEKALLQILIFKADDFAKFIAAATVPGYDEQPVRIDNLADLSFAYSSATTSISDIGNLSSIEFKLVGKPLLVWTFDEGKLKADLLNVSKTALTTILGAYPGIERAEAKVRPFWKRSFPTEMDEIKIIESVGTSD